MCVSGARDTTTAMKVINTLWLCYIPNSWNKLKISYIKSVDSYFEGYLKTEEHIYKILNVKYKVRAIKCFYSIRCTQNNNQDFKQVRKYQNKKQRFSLKKELICTTKEKERKKQSDITSKTTTTPKSWCTSCLFSLCIRNAGSTQIWYQKKYWFSEY